MGIIIRQSIKGTVATYLGAAIGFVTTMFVVTKFLLPEDIGLTRVIIYLGTLFGSLAQLGAGSSVFRFFPYFKDPKKQHNGFFFYLLLVPTLGCILISALYVLLRQPISSFFIERSELLVDYYYWVIPLLCITAFLGMFEAYTNMNMRISVPRFNREVVIRLLTLAVYLLFGYHVIGRTGLVAGTVLTYGGALLLLTVYMSRICCVSLRPNFGFIDRKLGGEILRYTAFVLASAVSGIVLGYLDTFMISSKIGLEAAGIYTIAFYIANVAEMPSRSISSISQPMAAEALKNGDFAKANLLYQKVALHQLLAGGAIFVLVWANIDNVFAIIPNGTIYDEGKWVVLFVGLSRLVSITLGFGGTLIIYSRYYYWSLYFTLFITALGIGTNLLLIPRLGITGAAIATAFTTLLSYLVQQFIVLRKVKGQPYTLRLLKVALILIAATCIDYLLPTLPNPWADGIVRSLVLAVTIAAMAIGWHVSTDVNRIARKIWRRVRRR